jgi:hypothetical protein
MLDRPQLEETASGPGSQRTMPPPQALFLWLALLGGFVAASSNANSSNATSSSYQPLPVTGASDLTPFSLATGTSHFVTARDGKLYLDDVEYTFSSFNAVG